MKSLEIRNKIAELKVEASALETAEEINAKIADIENLQAQLKVAEMVEAEEKKEIENKIKNGEVIDVLKVEDKNMTAEINDKVYDEAFYNALGGKNLTAEQMDVLTTLNNSFSSTSGEDGGYLIPLDQRTAIKELKRQMVSLEEYVNVEPVTTLTGSRNIEKEAEYTPFTTFDETGLKEETNPQFVKVNYTIKDRGGMIYVPNSLLKDNTAGLKTYINSWLAKKQVATRNKLILDLLATQAKTAIAGLDDIKNTFNVTLDPSISAISICVTNQSGFNALDKMKDSDGKYILQPDPTQPTKKLLFGLYPIVVVSNKILKNDTTSGTKAPLIMGSLKEAITLFDREAMSLDATNVGAEAFKKNQTAIRAITREDVEKVDFENTIVYGQLTV